MHVVTANAGAFASLQFCLLIRSSRNTIQAISMTIIRTVRRTLLSSGLFLASPCESVGLFTGLSTITARGHVRVYGHRSASLECALGMSV